MFATKITFSYTNTSFDRSRDAIKITGIEELAKEGYFDVLDSAKKASLINSFSHQDWNKETQTHTATRFSDTAEQAREFQHMFLTNQKFLKIYEILKQHGHSVSFKTELITESDIELLYQVSVQ
jgi:hypothetical protein